MGRTVQPKWNIHIHIQKVEINDEIKRGKGERRENREQRGGKKEK